MTDLNKALAAAAEKGLISADRVNDLDAFLSARGVSAGPAMAAASRPGETLHDALAAEESEQPRFLRGFHDILITIGVVVVLVGLWGIGGTIAVLPLIIVLAEILVRRQRLALPAVALTLALVHWVGQGMYNVMAAGQPAWTDETYLILAYVCAFPVPLGLFYWRYRVPLSFALFLLSIAAVAVAFVFLALDKAFGVDFVLEQYPHLVAAILLVAALAIFALAMRYDISDPHRLTLRSDIAFWLHLAAAPALLQGDVWWTGEGGLGQSAAVIFLVALFMTIGLVIDRRAFVTSGLLSLGAAIWTILQKSGASLDTYVFIAFAVVGLTVLVIGIFWQPLRRAAMSLLPVAFTARLHAGRGSWLAPVPRVRIEPEMDDVAVLDDVFLAFVASLAGLLRAVFAAIGDIVVIGDRVGADEAALEIRMDDAGGLRGLGAARDRPGAGLLRSNREIGDEIEELVAGADQTVEAGFLETERREEFLRFLFRKLRDFGFDRRRNDDRFGALFPDHLLDGAGVLVAGRGVAFGDVADVENRV